MSLDSSNEELQSSDDDDKSRQIMSLDSSNEKLQSSDDDERLTSESGRFLWALNDIEDDEDSTKISNKEPIKFFEIVDASGDVFLYESNSFDDLQRQVAKRLHTYSSFIVLLNKDGEVVERKDWSTYQSDMGAIKFVAVNNTSMGDEMKKFGKLEWVHYLNQHLHTRSSDAFDVLNAFAPKAFLDNFKVLLVKNALVHDNKRVASMILDNCKDIARTHVGKLLVECIEDDNLVSQVLKLNPDLKGADFKKLIEFVKNTYLQEERTLDISNRIFFLLIHRCVDDNFGKRAMLNICEIQQEDKIDISLLLDRVDVSDDFGKKVLMSVALRGYGSIVSLLLDRGAVVSDDFGEKILMSVERHKYGRIVSSLLDRGAGSLCSRDELLKFSESCESDALIFLDVSVDVSGDFGKKLLKKGFENEMTSFVSKLLDRGVELANEHEDEDGGLSLETSSQNGHTDIVSPRIFFFAKNTFYKMFFLLSFCMVLVLFFL